MEEKQPYPGNAPPAYPTQAPPMYPQQQPGAPPVYPPQQQPGAPPVYPPQQQPGAPTGYPPQGAPPMHSTNVVVTQPPPMTVTTVVSQPRFTDAPMPMRCPTCQQDIITEIDYKIGLLVWMVCGVMFIVGLWLFCCLIPFCIPALKDVEHRCPNCKTYLGKHNRLS